MSIFFQSFTVNADPDQTAPDASFSSKHYSVIKSSYSNFRVITANFSDVQIFRIFTVIMSCVMIVACNQDKSSGWVFKT